MLVLGFMTGTSLDAVDMAVLDTDGDAIFDFGPAGERKLTDATRDVVLDNLGCGGRNVDFRGVYRR